MKRQLSFFIFFVELWFEMLALVMFAALFTINGLVRAAAICSGSGLVERPFSPHLSGILSQRSAELARALNVEDDEDKAEIAADKADAQTSALP
jgi:hypothetical protein